MATRQQPPPLAINSQIVDANGRPTAYFNRIWQLQWQLNSLGGLPDGDRGDITVSASGTLWTVDPQAITNAKLVNVASATFKGRLSAGAGSPEDLTVAQATSLLDTFTSTLKGLAPASGGGTTNFLRADGTWTAPPTGGVTDGDKGDITVTASGATWTVDPQAITNAKLTDVATATFKGRTTAGTGSPEDLTVAQATSLLDTFTSTLKGLAPASGGGTTNFLRADGTWVAPAGGGGGVTVNVYTATGAHTWTKPAGAKVVRVYAWGAGGGGGGGRGGAAGTNRAGGAGGGGGCLLVADFETAELGATVTVTVGAGGTAGTGGSSANGGTGGNGGNTTFGTHLTAFGGGGGGPGETSTPAGGGGAGVGEAGVQGTVFLSTTRGGNPLVSVDVSDARIVQVYGGGYSRGSGGTAQSSVYGGGGGGSCNFGAGSGGAGGRSVYGGGGGAGGGSVNTGNTPNDGNAGGRAALPAIVDGGGGGGTAGTGSSGASGGAGTARASTLRGGDGGGGGACHTAGTGGAGGGGGQPGGGAGGGGGGTTTGGNGGVGGNGMCVVVTFT